jgi:integrase
MARRGHGEGSIYHRKDGRWAATITLENHKRKTFYGSTRREVQERLKIALREQQQGTLVTTPQQTVAQYLQQWLENHQSSVRLRTYERYEQIVRLHLVPTIGRISLQKLTPQQVQSLYTQKLQAGLSRTTVNTLHAMLHKALKDALRWNLVARNVCDAVSPPRRERHEIKPFTAEQAQQFISAAQGHPLEALFVLAVSTGMRRGEVLAVKWQDIDLSSGTLQVRRIFTRTKGNRYIEAEPKTEKSRRSIVLPALVVDLLSQHKIKQLQVKQEAGEEWQEHDLVFSTSLGTPLNPSKVVDRFKFLLKKAGLPNIRFHDLRHSAATILLKMGIHPKVVQELLGHNQISMTMDIYSHVMPTMHKEAMDRWNKEFE